MRRCAIYATTAHWATFLEKRPFHIKNEWKSHFIGLPIFSQKKTILENQVLPSHVGLLKWVPYLNRDTHLVVGDFSVKDVIDALCTDDANDVEKWAFFFLGNFFEPLQIRRPIFLD